MVLTVFDSEEIGSMTRQGADSTFLRDLLFRIGKASGLSGTQIDALLAASFLVSADNAHAKHPNYPEKSDPTNAVYLNRGIAIKYGPRYATIEGLDPRSSARALSASHPEMSRTSSSRHSTTSRVRSRRR